MKPEAILSTLTPKQQLALPLILSGMSSLEVSKKVGVKASTVSEWLHHSPSFKEAIDFARQDTLSRTADSVASVVLLAIGELARIIATSESDAVRLKACDVVLAKLRIFPPDSTATPSQFSGSINLPLLIKSLGYD
jgi:predicted transcriptional regulator